AIISIISSISFKFILHFSLCNLHFAIKRTLLTIYARTGFLSIYLAAVIICQIKMVAVPI
ncbi:MAG: hypothetical protein KKG50_05635, partial [Candidatus Omnitrophica bacterium]|nr:hypothetical protein [Candidatus Omnitrophota bacterium]